MRNTFGKTWWGEHWLKSLSNIDYSNRLPRGSSYANKGAVLDLKIKENHIVAKVAGSRPQPYKVDIIVPPFFDPERAKFIDKIIAQPTIISKLLHRELDPSILQIAENEGLKVFPNQWNDLKMQCSCPDWAVPCKHLAAVIYKLSMEIDNNPFLVFELHQLYLLAELKLRKININVEKLDIVKFENLFKIEKKISNPKFDTSLCYNKLHFDHLKPIHEALAKLLSDFPPFYSGKNNFKETYLLKINNLVRQAQRIVKNQIDFSTLCKGPNQPQNIIDTHSQLTIKVNAEFEASFLINDNNYNIDLFTKELLGIDVARYFAYQPNTIALRTATLLALHLIANGAIIPQIITLKSGNKSIRWLPASMSPEVKQLMSAFSAIIPPDIIQFTLNKKSLYIASNDGVELLLSILLTNIIQLLHQSNENNLFIDLFYQNQKYAFDKPGEEAQPGGIMSWLQKFYLTNGKYKQQIEVEITDEDSFEINFSIQKSTAAKLENPIDLKEILTLKKYANERFEILQNFTPLSTFIPGLDQFINSNGKKNIILNNATFTPFLIDIIPAIELLDIQVLLPKEIQNLLKPKRSLIINKIKNKSFFNIAQMLEFEWQISLGKDVIDLETFKKLLQKSDTLIKYKSNYIYVTEAELVQLNKILSKPENLSPYEILRAALSGSYEGQPIELSSEVLKLIEKYTTIEDISLPADLHADLRPYQKRGFSWMYKNAKVGFGSIIADDMGLGKTLQVITTILKFKEEKLLEDKKILIVVPKGLLSNWQSECIKFAPTLAIKIFHGAERNLSLKENFDVLITSYGIARNETSTLGKIDWFALIIDEAQNIKNYNTNQSKAIKQIKAHNYIAMSGTPVENRLSELWSILDFTNKGLMGNLDKFRKEYIIPIENYNNEAVANSLKKLSAPFMMRRLKTDKSIISDLPDKIEMDCFSTLTKEQASLYQKTVEKAMEAIEGIDGTDAKSLFIRQGLVLQLILALKQICNHPTQFLKNKVFDAQLSGKMELLFDILNSILDANEKVLIFSQFTEMGSLLERFIQEKYHVKPLYYHGGCSLKQRNNLIDSFQNNPADNIFLLSLKSAGTGLNLTAANHVIHFDLWWNPAVESQATDRAFRIGQKKNVMVHRFITKDTFEEKINAMIQSKKKLANMTLSTGENWIGKLNNKELKHLFKL